MGGLKFYAAKYFNSFKFKRFIEMNIDIPMHTPKMPLYKRIK